MEAAPGLHWVERIWDAKVYLLFEEDRIVVVDAALPGREKAVWRYLASLGYPPSAVGEIWLTHGDIDHRGSAAALQAASGAKVAVHHADAPLVEGRAERELGPVRLAGTYRRALDWSARRLFHYQPARVDRAVKDGDDLGGWQVVHTPGHTAGSVCFYHPGRRIIIVGDALTHQRGRLGAPRRIVAPDMTQARASIHKIAGLDFEICCFGHGPPLMQNAGQRVRELANSLV